MTTKSVGAGTRSKSWQERVPDCRSCNAEAFDYTGTAADAPSVHYS